jgi:hypothetical protein
MARRDCTDLDPLITPETIHLVQQLQHSPLHLPVSTLITIEPLRPNRIQLINEDDSGCLLLGEEERVTEDGGTLSNEHLNEGGASKLEECSVRLRCTGSRQQCLSSSYHPLISAYSAGRKGEGRLTRRSIHERTLAALDSQRLELVCLLHRKYNRLDQLLNLLIQSSNVRIRIRRFLIHLHRLDPRIVLGRQRIEDEVRVLVDSDEVSGLERGGGDEADEGEENGLARRGLDYRTGARALGVEVDVPSICLSTLFVRVVDI